MADGDFSAMVYAAWHLVAGGALAAAGLAALVRGSLARRLPVAEGVTDITAAYRAEVMDIGVLEPKLEPVLTCDPPAR